MEGCPEITEIADLVAGQATGVTLARLQDHLDGCSTCIQLVAELVRDPDRENFIEPPATGWRESRQLAEYRLVRPIGRGSSGQVWLAEDTLLDRMVAIKFVSAATRTSARERFAVEARAIARLSHPNVVTVHRVGEVEDQLYLVSELVRGQSLDLVDKPMPAARVKEIGIGLARGLAAAHAAGIVHRDIKPANAIVGERGEIKLLDFGLAKLGADPGPTSGGAVDLEASPDLTATGHLLGTPLYMAPEAWLGEPPGCAMDVFSLGAVLYELCTGEPPHRGPSLAAVRKSALGPAPAPIDSIDPTLAAIIARCLAREPGDRYETGEALRAALEAPPSVPRRASRRWIVPTAVGLVAASVATFAIAGRSERSPRAQPIEPQRCSPDRWCWDASWSGRLDGVWGAAPNDVWAVGERGGARHYDGRSWTPASVGTIVDLQSISGSAADDVWAVGAHGTIVHWDGQAWHEARSKTRTDLFAVWVGGRDDAWVTGAEGTILHWDGATWEAVPSPTRHGIARIAASSPHDIWASGDTGTLVHYDGKAWSRIDVGTNENLNGVYPAAADDVWVVGFHSVIRHWDGKAWIAIPVPEVANPDPIKRLDFPFNNVIGKGANDVWLVAKYGPLLHWDGARWARHDRGTSYEPNTIHMFAHDDAWLVAALGVVVHWDGKAWKSLAADPPYRQMRALFARGPDDVWSAGFVNGSHGEPIGAVQHWNGQRWHDIAVPAAPMLTAIAGSGDEIWAVGQDGTIIHDTSREPSSTTRHLRGVFAGTSTPWAVGDGGTILQRRDGAWHAIASGAPADLEAVWGSADDDVWAVGTAGTILHWQGARWTPVASGTTETLFGVWGSSARDIWVVGDDGITLHWNGRAWAAVFTNLEDALRGVSGTGPDDVWAVSNSDHGKPTIVHWNGTAWSLTELTTAVPLGAIVAVGGDEAWAVGTASTVLHHVPGGR